MFQQQPRRRNSNYDQSPGPKQIYSSNEGNIFRNSGRQDNILRNSGLDMTKRSMNSNHGMVKPLIDPDQIEPQSPDHLNESLNQISPRQFEGVRPIDIYIDKESPVAVSGYFPRQYEKQADKRVSKEYSPEQKQSIKLREVNDYSPDVRASNLRQSNGSEVLSSPKLNSTRRNYFRKDQTNKALMQSMRKSGGSLGSRKEQSPEDAERTRRNVSKHDQTMGGLHEQHGSQHDESKLMNLDDSVDQENNPQWHDVQVVQSEAGSQELVIENLENLGEATALIVTRDNGGNFKIGIQQSANRENNYSDVMSSAAGSTRGDKLTSLNKLKLRGKLGGGTAGSKNHVGVLPPAIESQKNLRTASMNSRSSKASVRTRVTMPQINGSSQPVIANKFKTFQDPNESRGDFNDPNQKFRTRNRESASDNKRLAHEQPYETQKREQQQQNLELRSQFQSQKAEEMMRQSRDLRHKQNLSMGRKMSPQVDTISISAQSRNDGVGYVKVLDPLKDKSAQKNPLDRSDSKMGPTILSNRFRKPSDASLIQPNTQIANTSIHSRDAITLNAGLNNSYMTPDHTMNKNNTISVRLQDQNPKTGFESGFNSFINGGAPPNLSLSVQQAKKDFQQLKRTMQPGPALSGLHNLQAQHLTLNATPQPSHFRNMSLNDAHITIDAMSNAAGGLASVEEAKSRASLVSRQSNTDMKGANLIKISPKHTSSKVTPRDQYPTMDSIVVAQGLDSKETSQINVLDKEIGDEEDNKAPQAPASPAKSIKQTEGKDKDQTEDLRPVMSPSRTDTAFYEGKAVNTDPKSNQNSPGSDRQLSNSKENLLPQTADNLNYHTTNEDGGDAYFPQILKYTENAPQESILSRDNYSTSNQPSTIQRNKIAAAQPLRKSGPSMKKKYFNKNASSKQLSPVRDTKMSGATATASGVPTEKQKPPRDIMQQNVARLEKQNPSAMGASVLSHSAQGEDEHAEFNQRATSLEHVSEETAQNDKLILNKDGSAYNIATNDIAAIPQATASPKRSTIRSKAQDLERNTMRSQELRQSLNASQQMKKQASKTSLRSSQRNGQLAKLSQSQRSKASLASKKSKGGIRAQSMLPVLGRQSDTERQYGSLKSSGRNLPKNIHNQSSLPGSSRKLNPEYKAYETETVPNSTNMMAVGSARVVAGNPPDGATLPMKLPSVASPTVGTHLAQSIRQDATLLSNEKNQPVQQSLFGQAGQDPGQPNKTAQSSGRPQPIPKVQDNASVLSNMANQMQGPTDTEKPIMRYMESSDAEQKSYPLKYFKGQDLELYYMEKQLKPGVEREIKEGFFEIRKKFGEGETAEQQVQVYVSHLCLHNYHPIFCKFNLDVVKTILNFSQIIYLKKGQTLYQQGFNDRYLYVILFGKLRLSLSETDAPIGQPLNIGWTVGEEILFKSDRKANGGQRTERCRSLCESCVLGIEKRSLAQIKRTLVERGQAEEFVKLEVVLRGNYLVKKAWRN